MSAVLCVSVLLHALEPDVAGGARIVGSIFPAGADGDGLRNVVFPCGVGVTPARFEVRPGRWAVSAALPSGTVLTEVVEAPEGLDTEVVIDAADAPYKTHAWQFLMGNIEASPVYHNPYLVPAPRSLGSRYVGAPGHPDHVRVTWVGDPTGWSFGDLLELADEPDPAAVVERLAASPPAVVAGPDETDGMSHLFRFGQAGPVAAAEPGGPIGHRQFLVVELAERTHLVTLPAPWDGAQIEVLVNARQSPTGSAISVIVRDQAVGAGLAYMARGSLDAAGTLFAGVEASLFEDVDHPLAAAAAAYVLTGTDPADEPAHWDRWLRTLRDGCDWLADGAVLWAVRRLRRARSESDLEQARHGLVEAFDRGVPVYTRGLSWLMDALSEFPDDAECARRLRAARRLSWSVDMREPFVILNLSGGTR